MPLPCIAYVISNNKYTHFIVIHEIKKEKIIISDPQMGIMKIDRKNFFSGGSKREAYKWTGIVITFSPIKKFEKIRRFGSIKIFYKKVLYEKKKNVIIIIIFSGLAMILNLLGAFYYKTLMDKLIPNKWVYTLALVSIGFIVLVVCKILTNLIRVKLMLLFGKEFNKKFSLRFMEHILKLPMKFHGSRKVGDIVARFSEIGTIEDVLSRIIPSLLIDIIFVIVGCALLTFENMKLFGIVVLISIAYIASVIIFKKKYFAINKRHMENTAETIEYLMNSLEGIEVVKAHVAEGQVFSQIENRYEKYLEAGYHLGRIENLQSALQALIGGIGEIAILWFGGLEVMRGNMTIGDLITYNVLIGYFFTPLTSIINLQSEVQTAIIAAMRIDEIEKIEIEKSGEIEGNLFENINFQNVNFGYSSEKNILSNINLSIGKGEKIAIVGESGSGKTTLVKLLLKFYDSVSGNILLDNILIDKVNNKYLRKNIVYVSPDSFIFPGTIKDNITLGNQDISEEEIERYAKIVLIDRYIMNLPEGYNSLLTEKGENLSKGQKQRICLLRALIQKPKVLILDEATSNLDTTVEKAILLNLYEELGGNTTVIIVTHRLYAVKNSDCIYVLKDGNIVANGKHTEIMKSCKYYVDCVKIQTSDI